MLLNQPLPAPGQRLRYTGFAGSADAYALADLARQSAPVAVLTATAQDAHRLAEEIRFFAPERKVFVLPDWETLPYDHFSPHQDLVSERLETLYQISRQDFDAVIIPVSTALLRLPPRSFLAAHTFFLKTGDRLDVDELRRQLATAGYDQVTQVVRPGECSIRGGLIDLFPMGSPLPYRIDLFDDEVESIRTFDADTQRTIYPVREIRLLPAREFPLDEAGITRFRQSFRAQFEGDPSKSALYKDISNGVAPAGIEYYLPLFFDETATLFEYLPEATLLVTHEAVEASMAQFWQDTQSRYNLLKGDRSRPLLSPDQIYLVPDQLLARLKAYPRLDLQRAGDPGARHSQEVASHPVPDVHIDRRAEQPTALLSAFLQGFPGRVLLVAESMGRRETIAGMLAEQGLKAGFCDTFAQFGEKPDKFLLTHGPLAEGFLLEAEGWAVLTEAELYATQVRQARRREGKKSNPEGMLRDLTELRVGDPVVHEQHGIGRYLGLISMDLGEGATEMLQLEYAGGDKLYVPVSQLHVISRYAGAGSEAAPLHKLGSGSWDKARRRAMEKIRDTAAELLNLYARRAARQGHAFAFKEHEYDQFAAGFPFEETPDQAAAIDAVIQDMLSNRPMDRLVCGDVGFGKTEVALRAAFLALMDGKQVAVLVPTTLLAEQHYQTFADRLADWPVKIAELSRFRSAKEIRTALEGLAEGRIDLVIGTHKLLSQDVKFKNLGLVIIDEEHRFGVRQKELLKALRAEVDVLTLTATPIPRTLSMSLEGLRDFSVIATAPQRRLSIKTFVASYSEGIIREAVLRELKRGGQVYFLHNDVDTIENMREKLVRIVPEARIGIAHGQMRERDLEQVMRDFYQQHFNLLLCSTIIETGIDIPSANTILIERADKFGLAQLHQLRGRVGRSHHQAYAYLLVPDVAGLKGQSKKRLEAIQMMEDLGAGFYLAMHDLEIRGAGELLGESQSGEMQEIGFTLYADMLAHAVKSLKAGKEPDMSAPTGVVTEINLHAPALLPENYCNDVHERLVIYKRLANCETLEALEMMREELIDRFGLLPDPARTLLWSHELRILSRALGVQKIDASEAQAVVQFEPNPPIEPIRIIQLIQSRKTYKLSGQDRLTVTIKAPDVASRVAAVKTIFQDLGA